jgi:ribose transport system permease protein
LNLSNTIKQRIGQQFQNSFIAVAFILVVVAFSALSPTFRTMGNYMVILRQVCILAVIAYGMTFVITAAHIDLSVGSAVALTSMVASQAISAGLGIGLAVVLSLAMGLLIGLVNGLIVAKLRLPSFLATLGMMGIIRGAALAWTKTMPIPLTEPQFGELFSNAQIMGVPVIVFWMLGALAICVLLYNFTPLGNYVKAVGGNARAAQYSGVSVAKITVAVFLVSGFLCGMGGILQLARMKTARPDAADIAMDAVTAVILGGTSLFGGKGSVIFTLIGALLLVTITNGLVILGVDSNVQQIIKGIIVILAVALGSKSE